MKTMIFLMVGLILIVFSTLILFFEFYNYNVKFPDTIIVLGYSLDEKDSKDVMEDRILKGIGFCDNNTKSVILTGGYYNKVLEIFRVRNETENATEAKAMGELWEKNKKKCNATVVLEEESITAFESAFNSIKVMDERDLKYGLVVSSKKLLHHYLDFYLAKLFSFSKIRFDIDLD